jgi:hypothetical protein
MPKKKQERKKEEKNRELIELFAEQLARLLIEQVEYNRGMRAKKKKNQ